METPTTPPTYQTIPTQPQETSPNPMLPRAENPPAMPAPKPATSKRWLWFVLLGIVVLAGAAYAWLWLSPATPAATPTPTPSATVTPSLSPTATTWTNVDKSLSLTYNSPLRPFVSAQDTDYLPICDVENALVCIVYPKSSYPNSNYSGAGLSVVVQDCAGLQWQKTGTETINGNAFDVYAIADSAAGHQSAGTLWRKPLTGGQCLDMALRIHTTTFENYPAGTITRFTDADHDVVRNSLSTAARTLVTTKK